MTYLDYQTYKRLGGKVDEAAFPHLYQIAVDKLNYYTLNKVEETPEVARCLARMIDFMSENEGDISSFTNGNVSVTFRDVGTSEDKLYEIAEELLPISMLSRCI